MKPSRWAAVALSFALVACGSSDEVSDSPAAGEDVATQTTATPEQTATASLKNAEGADVGTATATATDSGIRLSLQVNDLPPGEHGAHIHMTGQCDAPAFESAGSHWNPTNRQHGLESAEGPHAGDMPNLTVNPDGSGTLEYTLTAGTFDGLLDADGSAMVVHASADDQKTDPSGNSGARIACGVFSQTDATPAGT